MIGHLNAYTNKKVISLYIQIDNNLFKYLIIVDIDNTIHKEDIKARYQNAWHACIPHLITKGLNEIKLLTCKDIESCRMSYR